ncbi:DUF982 domain-containing protein [Rhizobium redzepovicii]|uniref:DUF982 domain-containing protein n=1 Tax=Rhizobium redzepovicii TaxID=2867518 RepID=A0AAW8P9Z7_9HYPH|nr:MULTISPECIES: DUF982 domain-containing protein [Rhizobium]MBB3523181.1 hypothetical protein [Rhizobium sp. BK456]MBY4589268.1 DUF982 domain-containing protein [Rhizobium redzepovicii]MBY4613557.1 DUF982 domain-containing protein [Rhizobium redzepovicii]MDF0658883.1 DUF982 domain-containing protein [Rhizobium sp. BC49]MDR9763867.1 DUF982 domain-containing protein [Rhizobium redzepovicii]
MAPQKQIERTWSETVFVQVGMSVPQAIGGASEALDFFANRWKGSRRKLAFAREICAAAVSGHVSQETARQAFIQAADEAKMSTCAPRGCS